MDIKIQNKVLFSYLPNLTNDLYRIDKYGYYYSMNTNKKLRLEMEMKSLNQIKCLSILKSPWYSLYIYNNKLGITSNKEDIFLSRKETKKIIENISNALAWDIGIVKEIKNKFRIYKYKNEPHKITRHGFEFLGLKLNNKETEEFIYNKLYKEIPEKYQNNLIEYKPDKPKFHCKIGCKNLFFFDKKVFVENSSYLTFSQANLIFAFLLSELNYDIPKYYRNKLKKIGY